MRELRCSDCFFFNAPATPEIYTLSLHDALPICLESIYEPGRRSRAWLKVKIHRRQEFVIGGWTWGEGRREGHLDRKSTRLNSSHVSISYAVFCLKKKKKN